MDIDAGARAQSRMIKLHITAISYDHHMICSSIMMRLLQDRRQLEGSDYFNL